LLGEFGDTRIGAAQRIVLHLDHGGGEGSHLAGDVAARALQLVLEFGLGRSQRRCIGLGLVQFGLGFDECALAILDYTLEVELEVLPKQVQATITLVT